MKATNPRSGTQRGRSKTAQACPGCNKSRPDWPDEGYMYGGRRYCCQGCAEGTGCTCAEDHLGSVSA
jgi:hypothetical protein